MTNDENRKIFALADHAVDEIDLALGNEFELKQRNKVEKILLDLVSQATREAKIEAYGEAMQMLNKRAAVAEDGDIDIGGAVARELDDAFVEIRALRDSLVETPVEV